MDSQVVDKTSRAAEEVDKTVVSRFVMPQVGAEQAIPLYVAKPHRLAVDTDISLVEALTVSDGNLGDELDYSRTSCGIAAGMEVSFATYFNAFPAGYWRRWTDVEEVTLTLTISGSARVSVFRSNARGNDVKVAAARGEGTHTFVLPLDKFGDGGWYWFNVRAGSSAAKVESGTWSVPASALRTEGTVSVSITTFNRPDYCMQQLRDFSDALPLLDGLDRIYLVDQGNKLVSDEESFDDVTGKLGEKFTYIRQPNLGGSGGFSRGMHEVVQADESDYILLLDDDIEIEPESIMRSMHFANACRKPTIVGGHMFNMSDKTVLHSYAEAVNPYTFFWGPVEPDLTSVDFAQRPLASNPLLHRRQDVGYNGWWMCLIPVSLIKEVGYSLPVFIKWDDAEYAMRASEHGVNTVSLPGAAVWHVPWIDKDDSLDWQAFYHQRNRWLVALLHSRYPHGGGLPKSSFMADVRHAMCMQYAVVDQRIKALEAILSGPSHLHAELHTRMKQVRQEMAEFSDAQKHSDFGEIPTASPRTLPRKGRAPRMPQGMKGFLTRAARGAVHQMVGETDRRTGKVEAHVAHEDSRWWRLGLLDSAAVTSADGTSFSIYRKQPAKFRELIARSSQLHAQLYREWDSLQEQYQRELSDFTGAKQWEQAFHHQD